MTYNSNFQGGMYENNGGQENVTIVNRRASYQTHEGKAAKKFLDSVNVMVFDENMFAETVLTLGGQQMTARTMQIVRGFINSLADRADLGMITEETILAARMRDFLDRYGRA